jgi:hypothetical protein
MLCGSLWHCASFCRSSGSFPRSPAAFSARALGFAVVGESSPRVFEKGPPEAGPELQLRLSPRVFFYRLHPHRGRFIERRDVVLVDGPDLRAQRTLAPDELGARVGKAINRRRRTLYKVANESEIRKAKRARRTEILAKVAERTRDATTTLTSGGAMPLCRPAHRELPSWFTKFRALLPP